MKKLKLISLVLGLSVIFWACSNDGGGKSSGNRITNVSINADNVISLTPDKLEIEVPEEYKNKKAFLLAINNTDQTINVTNSRSADSIQNELNNNRTINTNISFSIPAKLPELHTKFTAKIDNNRAAKSDTDHTEIIYSKGDKRDFYGIASDNTFQKLASDAELKAIGEHCRIWYKPKTGINLVDKDGNDITDSVLEKLSKDFDSIFEKETYIFGSNKPTLTYNELIDFNKCDKIEIIIYDLFDNYIQEKANNGGVYGYFTEIDFYKQEYLDSDEYPYDGYISNECEALHIDSYWFAKDPNGVISTTVHEFQHLLHCVNKTINSGGLNRSETWFNEMMSMVCEDIMQSQLNISDNSSPKQRLPFFNGYHYDGFRIWRDKPTDGPLDVYHSYANAYVFGAYLLRNYGIKFIRELAHNSYINKEAITKALVAVNADEKSFDQVFSNFYNVILNPTGNKFTLNRSISEDYTINNSLVTFKCDAINLNEIITISAENISEELTDLIYGSKENTDFYGPVLLNANYFNSLDPSGMFATYLGEGKDEYNLSEYKLINFNTNIGFYIVFVD